MLEFSAVKFNIARRTFVFVGALLATLGLAAPLCAGLAVTNVDSGSVYEFDSVGNGTLRADLSDGLVTPTGVTWNTSGTDIYFSDTFAGGGAIKKINPSDTVSTFVNFPSVISPVGLATDLLGNIYAANYLTATITKTDPFGATTTFATAAQGLVGPMGIAVDPFGNVYVADIDADKIIKFDSFGVPSLFADSTDGLVTPVDVAVDSQGNVFVADTFRLGGTVWKFGFGGGTSVFADVSDGVISPTGLAIDPANDDLYVANYLVNTIVKLDPLANASLFADSSDGLAGPWDLALPNTVVPEPSTLAIWSLLGLSVFACRRWKSSRTRASAA